MEFSTLNSQFSILISCRNEIDNLPNLLISIENQTYKPDEVIFVDDNSTDETYNVLINYSKKHNYIKVIKNTGKGKKSAGYLCGGSQAARRSAGSCAVLRPSRSWQDNAG